MKTGRLIKISILVIYAFLYFMGNRVFLLSINPLLPTGILGFRIIIAFIDTDPAMPCITVPGMIPASMDSPAYQNRLVADDICKSGKSTGETIAVSGAGL